MADFTGVSPSLLPWVRNTDRQLTQLGRGNELNKLYLEQVRRELAPVGAVAPEPFTMTLAGNAQMVAAAQPTYPVVRFTTKSGLVRITATAYIELVRTNVSTPNASLVVGAMGYSFGNQPYIIPPAVPNPPDATQGFYHSANIFDSPAVLNLPFGSAGSVTRIHTLSPGTYEILAQYFGYSQLAPAKAIFSQRTLIAEPL